MKAYPAIILFWALAVAAMAADLQEVQVAAAVSADTVGVQDQFQLTVRVSGSDLADVAPPRLPRLRGLRVVAGPSISTQFQWINGRSSHSKSFIYVLMPETEGQFRIEPIEVQVGKRIYRTEPIDVRVTAASAAPPARRPGFTDPFGEPDLEPLQPRPRGDEVFVTAELDRASAYVGQQVTLSYYLYTQVSVTGLQLQDHPPLNGFWVEDLEVESDPVGTRKVVDGREYVAYLIKKQALFPNTHGRLTIPPASFAVSARAAGGFFGIFGQSETLYRKTRETVLQVRPLPSAGQPPDFTNAVGSFALSARLDKAEAATGDAVTLEIRLSGSGNMKMIPDIPLPPMPDFTVYSSKRVDNVRPDAAGRIGGEKSWEYVLIPKVPGTHTIPRLSFSFFDPEAAGYRSVTTEPLTLRVARGSDTGGALAGFSGGGKQNLTRQARDINFIKLAGGRLRAGARPAYQAPWFYALAALPVLFNIGILLHRRSHARLAANPALVRSRKARALALARLKRALRAGRAEPRRFYDEAARALSGYLEDKFQLPEIALTGDVLERTLAGKGIAPEVVRETTACLQDCDFGRFVSASPAPEKMARLAQRIRNAIEGLERS